MDLERERWQIVLDAVKRASRKLPKPRRRPKFSDWLIAAMLLWTVAHDRPPSSACKRDLYGRLFRPRKLPSVSQFNRRIKSERITWILQQVHLDVGGSEVPTAISYVDGKPLTVGPASKDPDAKRGHILGGFAKGYKLHAWMSEDRRIPLWSLMPLNVGEVPVAEAMLQSLPPMSEQSLVLADKNYDARNLHKGIDALNGRLLVIPRGQAEHPVTRRQMGAARRELLDLYQSRPQLVKMVHKQRANAEGILGNLCSHGGGLGPLPAWVRRLTRVRRWVGCKIILYNARVRARQRLKLAA